MVGESQAEAQIDVLAGQHAACADTAMHVLPVLRGRLRQLAAEQVQRAFDHALVRGVLYQRHILIAAETDDDVIMPVQPLQRLRHFTNPEIAHFMAVRIVDLLEIVDVNENQNSLVVFLHVREIILNLFAAGAFAPQIGQTVMLRFVADLLIGIVLRADLLVHFDGVDHERELDGNRDSDGLQRQSVMENLNDGCHNRQHEERQRRDEQRSAEVFAVFDDQHHNQRELYQTQYLRDSEQWSAPVVVLAVDVVDHMVELRGNRQYDAERGRCVDDVKLLRTRLFRFGLGVGRTLVLTVTLGSAARSGHPLVQADVFKHVVAADGLPDIVGEQRDEGEIDQVFTKIADARHIEVKLVAAAVVIPGGHVGQQHQRT
ncbi:putative 200 kDa antigen p200 [Bifidobacterium adolescentis ATCC 15703]|uniref:200 kDa antigen p200 n=1 Tax=Bifidobacterium adolescentis (strain ATCC 15703 / DSM 20083 / NCTC 11814 / E194a) TaxID=367928 RepID=A1A392_BIFAA|nr:putative 200 kDa antigen p200 [Bifidobacterium adolescentis ATCC 15703]